MTDKVKQTEIKMKLGGDWTYLKDGKPELGQEVEVVVLMTSSAEYTEVDAGPLWQQTLTRPEKGDIIAWRKIDAIQEQSSEKSAICEES